MTYNKPLPRIQDLLWLAKLARPYPTTAGSILALAKLWYFNKSTQDFLRQFTADETFKSGDDFLDRCNELELLIREERLMSKGALQGPQL